MDIHKKFTFDDPEDSYWNQNSSTASASLFFRDGTNSDEARKALEMLGESQEQFSRNQTSDDTASSVTDSEKLSESDFGNKISMTSTPNRKPDVNRALFNDSASSFGDYKVNGLKGTASIVSESSIGSFNNFELNVNLDYSRLKSEHKKLQKHLERVRAERYRAPSIGETIKRIRACEPVSLDFYRTKSEKVKLLDAAIETLDRDVVTRVVVFLKSSLNNSMFREILLFKPEAADAYILYLQEAKEYSELIETLFALGKSDKAAMFEFMLASNKRQPEVKLQAVKKCLISGFSDPSLSKEAGYVRDYIDLLDRKVGRPL